jgi:hypothetical protein
MPRSRVTLFSWVVAIAFILATLLQLADQFNLVATPPDLPNSNMVDRTLESSAYFHAIWPVFLWTNLLFGIGFLAAIAFAFNVASAARVPGGLPTFKGLAAAGGVIAAISSIIPIGAAEATVFVQYCDCGFKDTEIVSQLWAQMVAEDIANWFQRVAVVVLAISLIALVREASGLITPSLRSWTYITAIALILAPVLATTELLTPDQVNLLSAVSAAVLIPVWAVWLGRLVDAHGRGAVASVGAAPPAASA